MSWKKGAIIGLIVSIIFSLVDLVILDLFPVGPIRSVLSFIDAYIIRFPCFWFPGKILWEWNCILASIIFFTLIFALIGLLIGKIKK